MPYNKGAKMTDFKIFLFDKENGDCPVEEFIKSQDNKMQAKIFGMLMILEEKGQALREPYSKALGDGIFEIRCRIGTDATRILYFFYYDGKIILTNGFNKKTQKTPDREINLAKKYRTNFLERMARNEIIRTINE